MTAKLRIFVSSVQKELEDERAHRAEPGQHRRVPSAHCTPVLYEFEPRSPDKALEGCLEVLDALPGLPAHRGGPVRHARWASFRSPTPSTAAPRRGIFPCSPSSRATASRARGGDTGLLAELDADGPKYKRFGNVIELQKEVRAALVKLLQDRFGIAPTSDENQIAEQTIEATSAFESQPLDSHPLAGPRPGGGAAPDRGGRETGPAESRDDDLLAGVSLRGLVWHDPASGEHYATAAGIVLLAMDPSAVFPHCRILADAYRGTEPDGDPRDHEDIRAPMPLAIERAIAFIDRNTRHPMRIVGLNRVRLDEYPVDALREALVNAVAHRQYEDAGRKIILEVFADRVVSSSPGLPPAPITLASLRQGKYRPCSRNPVLAQCLSYFHRIEERGSGFRRMHDQMLDHGLDQPLLGTDMGYFQVTFPGPGEDVERLRVPEERLLVTPAIEARLNERQTEGRGRGARSWVSDQRLAREGSGRQLRHGESRPQGARQTSRFSRAKVKDAPLGTSCERGLRNDRIFR